MTIDQTLIQNSAHGDVTSFCTLAEAFQKDVYRLCYFYSGDRETAYNLGVDSFLKIWNAIQLYSDSMEFRIWLLRITCNTCRESKALPVKTDKNARLLQILTEALQLSTEDAARTLDLDANTAASMQVRKQNTVPMEEPDGVRELVPGIRRALSTGNSDSHPLKFLSHFRFTLLAIIIVLVLLLFSGIHKTASGQTTVPETSTQSTAQEQNTEEDHTGELLPYHAASSEA